MTDMQSSNITRKKIPQRGQVAIFPQELQGTSDKKFPDFDAMFMSHDAKTGNNELHVIIIHIYLPVYFITDMGFSQADGSVSQQLATLLTTT